MTAKLSDTLTVPVLAMFVACGGAADTTPMDSGVPTVADTTAPSVVATSPEDGASGMGADTVVTITFSEPMSDTSVEADLGLIGFDAVTVSWNQDYTELTVTPDSPLEVVEVPIDSDTPGAVYGVVVSESATDLAGNPLEASTTVEFSVVRQRWGRLAPVTELTRVVTPSSLMFEDHDPLGGRRHRRRQRHAVHDDVRSVGAARGPHLGGAGAHHHRAAGARDHRRAVRWPWAAWCWTTSRLMPCRPSRTSTAHSTAASWPSARLEGSHPPRVTPISRWT